MLTIILRTLLISTLLFHVSSFAEEGDIERLMVPENQDTPPPPEDPMGEMSPEENTMHEEMQDPTEEQANTSKEMIENHNPNEENVEQVSEDKTIQETAEPASENTSESTGTSSEHTTEETEPNVDPSNTPDEESMEAKHAEESEMREVGAGEEPIE